MARTTKLTPKLRTQLCELISQGHYLEIACRACGVDYGTYRRWMQRGNSDESGIYRTFREAVESAQAKAEVELLNRWIKATPNDWKACRDLLERRFRDRWSRNDKVELSGNLNLNHDIDSDIDQLLAQLGSGDQVPVALEAAGTQESADADG